MMTTPSRTVIFLAILCMAAYSAFGAPTEVPTIASLPPSNHKDAADSSKEVKATSTAESPLEMEQESGTATSETSLKTSKLPSGQSNQLVKARQARSVPDPEDTSNEDESTDHATNDRSQRSRDMISCVSHPSNNTIPAAHIKGHGTKPFERSTVESSKYVHGYQQRWKCCEYATTPSHNPHAFVDGGMIFNQTDKTLRVPTCGYYHVFSQIYYQIDAESMLEENHRSVYHLLKFERNCPTWPEFNPVTVMAKSAVARDDTTTITSDVVRLCAGGKIWVEIPDFDSKVPCCPLGDEQGTFIAAYLVAETTCHWPPGIEMDNFNTE